MNKASISMCEAIGQAISASRRARNMKQSELASLTGIGINTMVSIEKGAPSVKLGLYMEVLESLGIQYILTPLTNLSADHEAISSMTELLPKRVTGKRR